MSVMNYETAIAFREEKDFTGYMLDRSPYALIVSQYHATWILGIKRFGYYLDALGYE
jgi:hypothetical protein